MANSSSVRSRFNVMGFNSHVKSFDLKEGGFSSTATFNTSIQGFVSGIVNIDCNSLVDVEGVKKSYSYIDMQNHTYIETGGFKKIYAINNIASNSLMNLSGYKNIYINSIINSNYDLVLNGMKNIASLLNINISYTTALNGEKGHLGLLEMYSIGLIEILGQKNIIASINIYPEAISVIQGEKTSGGLIEINSTYTVIVNAHEAVEVYKFIVLNKLNYKSEVVYNTSRNRTVINDIKYRKVVAVD